MPRTARSQSSFLPANFGIGDCFCSDLVAFDHLFVVGLRDCSLSLGEANFDIFVPAIVGAGVSGSGGLLLHVRLAVVDFADVLVRVYEVAFLNAELDKHAGLFGGQLDFIRHLYQAGNNWIAHRRGGIRLCENARGAGND